MKISHKTEMKLTHKFVEYIPEELADQTIYISIPFTTVVHKCCCGCGAEITTPLSPTDWTLLFNGDSISLYPSIGNWHLTCQSHYWIKRNEVLWSGQWSRKEIEEGRTRDRATKEEYFDSSRNNNRLDTDTKKNFWQKLKKWFRR